MGNTVNIQGSYGDPEGSIHLLDENGYEVLMWDSSEWLEDPSLTFVIANAISMHMSPAGLPFTYMAEFTAEAWLNDHAISVDPEGDTVWDATVAVKESSEYFSREAARNGDWIDVQDNSDVLKDDPNAPEWVREWSGPFTIRVTRHLNPDY